MIRSQWVRARARRLTAGDARKRSNVGGRANTVVGSIERQMIVVGRALQQHRVHRDRRGRAEQAERPHPRAVAGGGLEGDERAHAVADQRRLGHAGGGHERDHPFRHLRNGPAQRPGGAAMAGQIERQHAAARGLPARTEERSLDIQTAVDGQRDVDFALLGGHVDSNGHGCVVVGAWVAGHAVERRQAYCPSAWEQVLEEEAPLLVARVPRNDDRARRNKPLGRPFQKPPRCGVRVKLGKPLGQKTALGVGPYRIHPLGEGMID